MLLLRFDHFNKTVPNMMAYFQIAASLINKFGVRLQNRADADQILNYYVYILVANGVNGREGILEYYCNCIGRRTVGCCAHVMTLVWYLGWARYENNIVAPAAFLDEVVVREDIE
ncbi:hypothetical protein HW555_010122 [Spodoptera exigua]|uniref:SWIM-type domain-containing protein n=1 Tax=Spodoptera exigua TaxID=7107 RepID=A0A835G7Z7_SPOEX|nr:hypothetical protein HW555_010122 [Spodoptera exigua]